MPCTTNPILTPTQRDRQRQALARLQAAIGAGTVQVVIAKGSIAFKGWAAEDREGVADLCAYRALANTPEVRRAVIRAEAATGQRIDPRAIASGMHSHDGGRTWGTH
jgi:hypothetical protein